VTGKFRPVIGFFFTRFKGRVYDIQSRERTLSSYLFSVFSNSTLESFSPVAGSKHSIFLIFKAFRLKEFPNGKP